MISVYFNSINWELDKAIFYFILFYFNTAMQVSNLSFAIVIASLFIFFRAKAPALNVTLVFRIE